MTEKRIAHVFEEVTGLYHFCSNDLPYRDARGPGYKSKAAAVRAAWQSGYTHAMGGGCPWTGLRLIPGRFRVEGQEVKP
ncbi:hypothetical protein [Desulfatiglans anilini]|uniref:hypothetical protein n=1 Tax=Desulfatiglans anilini TaxID=90728 RepID=UPI0004818E6B|nr:hypothetical protein [Desulfatiglans anilini]